MAARAHPTVLKRYVALELRRLREAAGLKREQMAERLGCSLSHIAQLEVARRLPRNSEVEVLLGAYGVPARIEAFQQLVTSARKGTDWWAPFAGAAPDWFDLFIRLESSAAHIDVFAAIVVPGLLQTPTYAEQIIRIGEPDLTDVDVARRVDLRVARQDVLARDPDPPTVQVVLDESVLHRPAGKQPVLAEQLAHLLKVSELPHVAIQVLPIDSGVHAAVSGTFVLMAFPAELVGDHGVAYAENRIRGTYFDEPDELDRYRTTFAHLQTRGKSPEASRSLIAQRLEELTPR